MGRQSWISAVYVLAPEVEEMGCFVIKTTQGPAQELQGYNLIPKSTRMGVGRVWIGSGGNRPPPETLRHRAIVSLINT